MSASALITSSGLLNKENVCETALSTTTPQAISEAPALKSASATTTTSGTANQRSVFCCAEASSEKRTTKTKIADKKDASASQASSTMSRTFASETAI